MGKFLARTLRPMVLAAGAETRHLPGDFLFYQIDGNLSPQAFAELACSIAFAPDFPIILAGIKPDLRTLRQ